jgi:hypothetical protein
MATSADGFRKYFAPTFNTRGDTELEVLLAAVELRVSDSWGAQRDEMVYLYAADQLETSPAGRAARQKAGLKGPTVYSELIADRIKGNAWAKNRLGTS